MMSKQEKMGKAQVLKLIIEMVTREYEQGVLDDLCLWRNNEKRTHYDQQALDALVDMYYAMPGKLPKQLQEKAMQYGLV